MFTAPTVALPHQRGLVDGGRDDHAVGEARDVEAGSQLPGRNQLLSTAPVQVTVPFCQKTEAPPEVVVNAAPLSTFELNRSTTRNGGLPSGSTASM